MTTPARTRTKASGATPRRGKGISLSAIRRMARQIADHFQPEKIILFGSYAAGRPTADSDVDVLVVMPARNEVHQAIQIREIVDHPFPLDLIVRTPKHLQTRLKLGDWFLREIMNEGKVLYEKVDGSHQSPTAPSE